MMDDDDAITVPVDAEVKDKANAILKEYGTDVAGFVRDIVVDIAAMDEQESSRGSRRRILRSPLYSKDWKTGAKVLIGHCEVTFSGRDEKIPNAETEAAIRESFAHTGRKFSSVEALMADLNADD